MIQISFAAAYVFLFINYSVNLRPDKKYNIFVK